MSTMKTKFTFKLLMELSKVKITFAVAFTTIAGYLLAKGSIDTGLILPTIGIFLLVEFIFAMLCELLVGSPYSMKLALKAVTPENNPPFLVETAIICCTVCIMCPLMSFIAVFICYYCKVKCLSE